jgi:dipeptidyl aminopeptidase/acylaminoacyl peptidase
MRISRFLLCVFLSFLTAGGSYALEKHPFSVHDMLAMERISDHQVSPDGNQVAFVLRTTDLEANEGRTDIWLVGHDGTGLGQLTKDSASDFAPRWSADGKSVYFLSTRSGSSQVWKINIHDQSLKQITDLPVDVGNLILSPDGKQMAFSMEVFVDCPDHIECTEKRLKEIEERKTTGIVFDKLFIRHWDTWKDGRRSHIFVRAINGGEIVDVMKGMDADCPAKPFGGVEEMAFTADGKGIVFSARDVGRTEAWSTDFDLYYTPIDGSRAPQCLTEQNKAWDAHPLFSPDGKTLAYLAMERPGYESDRFRIALQSWPDGKKRTLVPDWDRSVSGMAWAEDGKTIYATANNLGQCSLYAINVRSGKVTILLKKGTIRSFVVKGDRIVFGMDHLKSPVELYSIQTDGRDFQSLTGINREKLAAVNMGEPEQFTFKGWNNEPVYGYVVKPIDFDPNQKYPVAFLIHGGPQGSFGNDFHYRWNPQAYAGAGYAAVMVDFHGSVGYGQAFTDSIRGDWGGKPLEDLQKGLAAAMQRYPWMDKERVGALGASFGGYMINWIAGNWPDRFRCLVNHDGNLDERLAYYDTEELWFPEWDHEGTPWDHPEGYEEHNPINYVRNWKTPMLVIHGALDFRVAETQGISTFTALQRLGIPSKFLYFPDENHWVLKPQNSIQWHETVLAWLDHWLKGDREGSNE